MRRVVSLAAAFFVVACSGGGGGRESPPPPTGAIRLINNSSYDIDEVYVALSSAASWGGNRTSSPIPPSYSLTVGGLVPDYWDVEAVSWGTSSDYFAYAWGAPVVANDTLDLSATNSNFSGSLKVTNGNGTYSLTGLYVVPNGTGTWGSNYLTGGAVAPGSYYLLYDMPSGYYYDVRCVHSDGGSSTGTHLISAHSLTSITCT